MEKKAFLKNFDSIPAVYPVQGIARALLHNGLEFPTTRDEYWKYTRVGSILNHEYEQNKPNIESIDQFDIQDLEAYNLVFVNGVFNRSLSDALPSSVEMFDNESATKEQKDWLSNHLDHYIDSKQHAFSALNTSYFTDGAYIKVGKGEELEKPIRILHITEGDNQASNVRNLMVLEDQAKATFLTQFEGMGNKNSFTNVVNEIVTGHGANGVCYLIQNEGAENSMVNTTQVVQGQDSTMAVFTITESGKLVRNNLNFTVRESGCTSNMYGIYLTGNKEHVDNHTHVDHLVPNCDSNELYKGVMTDASTAVFNGKILVHRDAQQTNAFQSNQNLVLSDRATINTKPELEIYADDVKCSHGCTIGDLDQEAMFYLRSRGLDGDEASKLLVQAFAGGVIEEMELDALKSYTERFVHRKLSLLND